ncbi:hypothetical protein ACFRDV_09715 [Streptomyces fagopyri]|uniref:hypothetical protein n=1 Tax=Streptomyces fagopyri TaxID=2662397 RepID=UPI0036B9D89A
MTEGLHIWSRESSTRLQDQRAPVVVQVLTIRPTALALLRSFETIPTQHEQVLGDTYPQTLITRNNLANARHKAKLYSTTATSLIKALPQKVRILPEHQAKGPEPITVRGLGGD